MLRVCEVDSNDLLGPNRRMHRKKQVSLSTAQTIHAKLDFKFPLTVSCVHFICSSIRAYVAIHMLKDRWKRIFPMSFVFCMNIVLGNVSMRYIPVSFMRTIKSFRPIILQCLVWRKHFEWRIWASLVPIVGAILLTSMTELSFNIFGFCATMIGCLTTSTKTILAESLLHGYKFDSILCFYIINTLYYMAPFATMILALPAMLLEGGGVIDWSYTHDGVLAFFLNFSIFYVIHSTTAVTFNVVGNLKVAVAVLVSWLIFRNPISPMNAIGCAITLVGCTFYGYVRHLISQQKAAAPLGNQGTNSPRSRVEMLPLVGDKEDKELHPCLQNGRRAIISVVDLTTDSSEKGLKVLNLLMHMDMMTL
ncbi:hypothetical protein ZWY2020_018929 [Hordeum vulgare]|nr:hypothetical protein ZWY2020_018929 [Hordeum vulgare]